MIVSFAVAVAIVEIACALLPPMTTPPDVTVVAHVHVASIQKRVRSTPPPTPPPIRAQRIAQAQLRSPIVARPGASHASPIRRAVHAPPAKTRIVAAAAAPAGGQSGNAGATGVSGTGNGGAPAAQQPCGAVDFDSAPVFETDSTTGLFVYTHIIMNVHVPDGHVESVALDWPWHYRDPSMDPFKHADAPMWLQFPPKSMQPSEPPIVQYVMAHTTPEGSAELADCPDEPSATTSP
jgi:hypothetical protein